MAVIPRSALANSNPDEYVIHEFGHRMMAAEEMIRNTGHSIKSPLHPNGVDIAQNCKALTEIISQLVEWRVRAIARLNTNSTCACCVKQKCFTWFVTAVDAGAALAALVVSGTSTTSSSKSWWSTGTIGLSTVLSKVRDAAWLSRVEWIRIQTQLEQIQASEPMIEHFRATLAAFNAYQRLRAAGAIKEDVARSEARAICRLPASMESLGVTRESLVRPLGASNFAGLVKSAIERRKRVDSSTPAIATLARVEPVVVVKGSAGCCAREGAIELRQSGGSGVIDVSRYYQRGCTGLTLDITALEDGINSQFLVVRNTVKDVGKAFNTADKLDLSASIDTLKAQHRHLVISFAVVRRILDQESGKEVSLRNRVLCRSISQGFFELCAMVTDVFGKSVETTGGWNQAANIVTFALFGVSQVVSRGTELDLMRVVNEADMLRGLRRLDRDRHMVESTEAILRTFTVIQPALVAGKVSLAVQEDALMACSVPSNFQTVIQASQMQASLARRFGGATLAQLEALQAERDKRVLGSGGNTLRGYRRQATRRDSLGDHKDGGGGPAGGSSSAAADAAAAVAAASGLSPTATATAEVQQSEPPVEYVSLGMDGGFASDASSEQLVAGSQLFDDNFALEMRILETRAQASTPKAADSKKDAEKPQA